MLKSRRIWLALAIAALVAVSFAASVVAARRASDPRRVQTTHGLDYLHARQGADAGFSNPENTAWAILGMIAKRERQGTSAWRVKGVSPFQYLQKSDLAAGSSSGSDNAPVYYSRLIMAFVAARESNQVGSAGSRSINLLAELWKYQNADTGAFAALPNTNNAAIHSTAWAILAMYSLLDEPTSDSHFQSARTWLATQQNADGGFSSSVKGADGNVVDTALAAQALEAGPNVGGWSPTNATDFLQNHQNGAGGFAYMERTSKSQTDATAAAIQGIQALGGDPHDWKTNGKTPFTALNGLILKNGSYKVSDRLGALGATSWALVAQDDKSQPFTVYPKRIPEHAAAFRFRPQILTISPKNGAKFTGTHIVLIRATYTDHKKGTGIRASACRLYVDKANRTRAANITKYGLHLQLKNVPNGDHTYTIKLVDYAGNEKTVERKFTVAVPTPTPTSTATPTIQPTTQPTVVPPVFPTQTATTKPFTPTPTPTLTPSVTPYPYPSPTSSTGPVVTGSPVPSPSTSASPAGAGAEGGGGSAAGFVGGTLLAMLPIGAAISYLLLHRKEEILDTASQGAVLAGGGSAWERVKRTLAKSKDLTRPSSRE